VLAKLASKIEIVVNVWKVSHEKQSPISLTICTDCLQQSHVSCSVISSTAFVP
jgi:hypothetical protein